MTIERNFEIDKESVIVTIEKSCNKHFKLLF